MNSHNGDLFSDTEWSTLAIGLSLSPRQAQIVQNILDGMSDRQVASDLGISVPTVRTHLSRLFGRLDVQNRLELALCVFREFRASCPTDHSR